VPQLAEKNAPFRVDCIDDASPALDLLEIEETGNFVHPIALGIKSLLHAKFAEHCENRFH
jgi:hypothetical protein